MTFLATFLLELTFVRIEMAEIAGRELQARVMGLSVGTRFVALLTSRGLMHTRQWEEGLAVVKAHGVDGGALPVRRGVALRAARAESALMCVLMAVDAARR